MFDFTRRDAPAPLSASFHCAQQQPRPGDTGRESAIGSTFDVAESASNAAGDAAAYFHGDANAPVVPLDAAAAETLAAAWKRGDQDAAATPGAGGEAGVEGVEGAEGGEGGISDVESNAILAERCDAHFKEVRNLKLADLKSKLKVWRADFQTVNGRAANREDLTSDEVASALFEEFTAISRLGPGPI